MYQKPSQPQLFHSPSAPPGDGDGDGDASASAASAAADGCCAARLASFARFASCSARRVGVVLLDQSSVPMHVPSNQKPAQPQLFSPLHVEHVPLNQ